MKIILTVLTLLTILSVGAYNSQKSNEKEQVNKMATLDLAKAFGSGGLQTNSTPGLSGSPIPAALIGTPVARTAPAAPVAPAPDPYAAYGGRSAYDGLVSGFNSQKDATVNSAIGAADRAAGARNLNILDFLDTLRAGQAAVETKAANNERARFQGNADIRDSVGKGVRNVGQLLQGRNASGASVGGEIARAIGDQGRRQSAGIENQYELGNMDIANEQNSINTQRESGRRRFEFEGKSTVDDIVSQAEAQLSAINTAMANASLPDRIALDAEKNRIRGAAQAKLAASDATLNSGLGGIQAGNTDTRRAEGQRLMQLGTPQATQFNYSPEIPIELQGSGPFSSDLPLFTYGNKRQLA